MSLFKPYNNPLKPKYFYETIENVKFKTDLVKGIYFSNEWLYINNGAVTVSKGYVFNGASPRWEWFGCEWGTPQGRGLSGLRGFCIHDALWQFHKEIGISKRMGNDVQLMVHKKDSFKPGWLYYKVLNIVALNK